MGKIVYGPTASFYDDDPMEEFQILEEEDGLFFEFVGPEGNQIVGCTLVRPQLKELVKILKDQIKRIKAGGN